MPVEEIFPKDNSTNQIMLFNDIDTEKDQEVFVSKISGDMLVVKENSLARTALDLSLAEHRLVSVISSLISPTDLPGKKYYFYVKDFCHFFGLVEDGNHTQLRKTFLSLRSKSFEINRKGEIHITGWINHARIIKRTGIVEVDIDPNILPFLLYVQENYKGIPIGIDKTIGFIKHPLENLRYFTTAYAYNLYSFFKSLLGKDSSRSYYMSIEDLRKALVVKPKEYEQYIGLKTRVLLPAIAEITGDIEMLEKLKRKKNVNINYLATDMGIKFAEKRGKQKKVEGIMFHLTKIDTIQHYTPAPSPPPKEENPLIKEIMKIGISKTVALRLSKNHTEYQILSNIAYAKEQEIARKNTDDPIVTLPGFTKHCIETNAAASGVSEYELEQKEKQAQEKQKREAIQEIAAGKEEQVATTDAEVTEFINTLSQEEVNTLAEQCQEYLKTTGLMHEYFKIDKIFSSSLNASRSLFYSYIKDHILAQTG